MYGALMMPDSPAPYTYMYMYMYMYIVDYFVCLNNVLLNGLGSHYKKIYRLNVFFHVFIVVKLNASHTVSILCL